jgi:hypothetical protein
MSKKKGKVSLASAVAVSAPPPVTDTAIADPHTVHIESLLHDGASLNKDAIRRACREDGIPHALRGAVWQVLLDVWGRDDDTLFDGNVVLDLKDQAVIQVDLDRTRTDEPTFAHKAARDEAAALLTLYAPNPHQLTAPANVLMTVVFLLFCQHYCHCDGGDDDFHLWQVLQAAQRTL